MQTCPLSSPEARRVAMTALILPGLNALGGMKIESIFYFWYEEVGAKALFFTLFSAENA